MLDVTHIDPIEVDPTQVIERVTLVAPLGLRFWDEVSGKTIGNGLVVTAYPATNPQRRVRAFSNPSGIYVFRHLPGLRDFEHGSGDNNFWESLPPRRPFVIEVDDRERRFQPFLLTTHLPVRDVFVWEDPSPASPPSPTLGVPLYSAPSRSVPAAMAVIRAELRDPWAGPDHQGGPAAWAVIEAHIPGQPTVRGIANDKGRIALIFPYPDPGSEAFASPPDSPLLSPPAGSSSLRHQVWNIALQAAYKPMHPVPVGRATPPIPDLRDILMQPPATLWADTKRTKPLTEARLTFGQELILRSTDFTTEPIGGTPMSVLLITPAGSPP